MAHPAKHVTSLERESGGEVCRAWVAHASNCPPKQHHMSQLQMITPRPQRSRWRSLCRLPASHPLHPCKSLCVSIARTHTLFLSNPHRGQNRLRCSGLFCSDLSCSALLALAHTSIRRCRDRTWGDRTGQNDQADTGRVARNSVAGVAQRTEACEGLLPSRRSARDQRRTRGGAPASPD